MSDPCPAQTEGLNVELVCDWLDGHMGQQHWDATVKLLWSQPPSDPEMPPYRGAIVQQAPMTGDPEITIPCPTCSAPAGEDCQGFGYCPARSAATNWAITTPRRTSQQPPEYRSCRCGPDGQQHWHTITPTPWDGVSVPGHSDTGGGGQ